MNDNKRMDNFRRTGKDNDRFLTGIIYGNGRSLGSHPGKIEVLSNQKEEAFKTDEKLMPL